MTGSARSDFTVIVPAYNEAAVLPDLVRWIAYLLPTTYALDLMRVASLGTPPLVPLPVEWAMLALTSLGFVAVGRWAWLRTEHRLRRLGTLGQH